MMRFQKRLSLFGMGFVFLSVNAQAFTAGEKARLIADQAYFLSSTPKIKVVPYEKPNLPTSLARNLTTGISSLESSSSQRFDNPLSIANVILKVWDIVQKNRPVANVESKAINALPKVAENNWVLLSGWKPEHGIHFSFEVENLYGMKTVELEYDVELIYGGNVHGVGQYIASARVIPTKVSVLWAYDLDVSVNVASVFNAGTVENPKAAVAFDVNYTYGSLFKKESSSNRYLLQGDGTITHSDSGEVYFGN